MKLLAEQVSITEKKDLINEHVPSPHNIHSLNSMLGHDVVAPVENYIKKSRDKEVDWRVMRVNGEQFCAGFTQALSDKTYSNLAAAAFEMYPLQVKHERALI